MATLDNISLLQLQKVNFQSKETAQISLAEYKELSNNILSYLFSVCEAKALNDKIKFLTVSIIQRYLKVKN